MYAHLYINKTIKISMHINIFLVMYLNTYRHDPFIELRTLATAATASPPALAAAFPVLALIPTWTQGKLPF